jgi:hypothetical protein
LDVNSGREVASAHNAQGSSSVKTVSEPIYLSIVGIGSSHSSSRRGCEPAEAVQNSSLTILNSYEYS